ncbi:hypothetical protein JYT83_01470, partial [bacterium AH-315-F18]|nr:hypothetical protein [bacterium AH-315-F18]
MDIDTSTLLGAWTAAALTLFMFSFLYKDNPFFKFGEHLFMGITVGYMLVINYYSYIRPKWYEPLFHEGDLWKIIPGV